MFLLPTSGQIGKNIYIFFFTRARQMTPNIPAVSQCDTTIVTNTILQFLFLTLSIFSLPDLAHYHANESNLLRVWHSQSMFFVWEISFRIYLHSWQRLFKFCLLCIQSVCAVFAGKNNYICEDKQRFSCTTFTLFEKYASLLWEIWRHNGWLKETIYTVQGMAISFNAVVW